VWQRRKAGGTIINDIEVRLNEALAKRQQRVSGWLLVLTILCAYYLVGNLSVRFFFDGTATFLRVALAFINQVVLAILIGMHIAMVFLLGGLIRQVKLPVFSEIMLSTLSLIPGLQLCVGWVVCLRLGQSWREHEIDATYRGPTASGIEALRAGVRCDACAYDVRGVMTGACPECGAKIKRPADPERRESMQEINVFWLEFIGVQDALRQAQSADDDAYERLLQRLHKIDDRLYIEFATGEEPELIITAHGDRDCFAVVNEVVAAAPEDTGWKIFALKPRQGFPEVAEYESFEVRLAEVRFEPLRREGSQDLGLRVYVPNWRADQAEQALLAIMNACDHGLGERIFANRVQHVEVRPYDADADSSELIPLVELDKFLGLG